MTTATTADGGTIEVDDEGVITTPDPTEEARLVAAFALGLVEDGFEIDTRPPSARVPADLVDEEIRVETLYFAAAELGIEIGVEELALGSFEDPIPN